MPPQKPKLPEETIAAFARWIELGAPDPREESLAAAEHWPKFSSAIPERSSKSIARSFSTHTRSPS